MKRLPTNEESSLGCSCREQAPPTILSVLFFSFQLFNVLLHTTLRQLSLSCYFPSLCFVICSGTGSGALLLPFVYLYVLRAAAGWAFIGPIYQALNLRPILCLKLGCNLSICRPCMYAGVLATDTTGA